MVAMELPGSERQIPGESSVAATGAVVRALLHSPQTLLLVHPSTGGKGGWAWAHPVHPALSCCCLTAAPCLIFGSLLGPVRVTGQPPSPALFALLLVCVLRAASCWPLHTGPMCFVAPFPSSSLFKALGLNTTKSFD